MGGVAVEVVPVRVGEASGTEVGGLTAAVVGAAVGDLNLNTARLSGAAGVEGVCGAEGVVKADDEVEGGEAALTVVVVVVVAVALGSGVEGV